VFRPGQELRAEASIPRNLNGTSTSGLDQSRLTPSAGTLLSWGRQLPFASTTVISSQFWDQLRKTKTKEGSTGHSLRTREGREIKQDGVTDGNGLFCFHRRQEGRRGGETPVLSGTSRPCLEDGEYFLEKGLGSIGPRWVPDSGLSRVLGIQAGHTSGSHLL
jgi:hypothetical protein